MHLHKVRLNEKSCLAAAGAADDKYIFVSCILRVLRAAAHHQPFGLCQQHVIFKYGVDIWLYILGIAPPGRTILDPVAILLSVLAFQVDRHAKDHRTGYADQQVRGMETEPRGGKGCREAVPNGKQLARKVSTGRKPESLCQLIEGIYERDFTTSAG